MVDISGVNIVKEIVYLEYQLKRTQKILEKVINDNIGKLNPLDNEDIKKINESSFAEMKEKFPQLGLKRDA